MRKGKNEKTIAAFDRLEKQMLDGFADGDERFVAIQMDGLRSLAMAYFLVWRDKQLLGRYQDLYQWKDSRLRGIDGIRGTW